MAKQDDRRPDGAPVCDDAVRRPEEVGFGPIALMFRMWQRWAVWFKRLLPATKQDLENLGKLIMSKITEFADAVDAHNAAVDTAIQGLSDDIANLNKQIQDLQNSAGQITPEDQARLDAIQARSQTVAEKLAALDALTPPAAPPTT